MTPEEVDALPESGGFDSVVVPVVDGVAKWTAPNGMEHEKICAYQTDKVRFVVANPAFALSCRPEDYVIIADTKGVLWRTGVGPGGVTYKMRAGV